MMILTIVFTNGDIDYPVFNEWGGFKAWLLHYDVVYTPNFSFENDIVAGYLLTTTYVSGDCVKIDTFSGSRKNMWFVNLM